MDSSFLEAALTEDLGSGDITSELTVDPHLMTKFQINTREPLVVAGINIAKDIFLQLDPEMKWEIGYDDGDSLDAGACLLQGFGKAQAILSAERTALNILQYLSGIATLTQKYVQACVGCRAQILDTRKTLPLYRQWVKHAVRCGGGKNHRFGLYDGILVKDNHIALCGGISQAVARAKKGSLPVEVECDNFQQVEEAVDAGADMLLLDNMSPSKLKDSVEYVQGRIPLEASGGINLETVRSVAETGVDFISVGRLTHSVYSVDIGLDIFSHKAVATGKYK